MSLLLVIALVWLAIGLLTSLWLALYVAKHPQWDVSKLALLLAMVLVVVAGPVGLALRIADVVRHKRGLLG